MRREDKELLFKDLCARLPYGVIIHYHWSREENTIDEDRELDFSDVETLKYNIENPQNDWCEISWKPYLRPMSSMTEEEKEELLNRLPKYWSLEIDKLGDLYFDICDASYPDIELLTDIIDWLNAHHFDYRGLIEKGLAIEVTEGMYD